MNNRPPCSCKGRGGRCDADGCDHAPANRPYSLDQCRVCWLYWNDDLCNRAWGGPGVGAKPTAPPCRHKGAELRRLHCATCAGKAELKVFACAVHGECTPATPAAGVRGCCHGCADYGPPLPAFNPDPGRVRHLLYHVYPHARDGGAVWRWNVGQLKRRISLFNGRRMIGVAVGPETEPASAVREALAGLGCEFIERPNDPRLGEMVTFPALLESAAGFIGPDHATFYGHAKAVTSHLHSPTVIRWAESMYESCLDYWPLVYRLLREYPLVGPWKRNNWGWRDFPSRSRWHFSGTFRWSRNDDFYRRNWREIDQFPSGSESHPSLHFEAWEAASLIGELHGDGPHLYAEACWRALAQPALDHFRREHAADRHRPTAHPSFAVVCIVHDESAILDAFLDHYAAQGVDRMFIVDNGSTDDTAAKAARRPDVEVSRLESAGLDDELRTAHFQRVRESLAGRFDWVILADADELIVAKGGGTIRDVLRLHTAAAALGADGWDVIQGPDESPMDWTRPPLQQRRYGVPNEAYSKPVVLRPGGPERLHCGQHRFRGPEPYPPERPFWLYHLAHADESLFLSRRLRMTARQTQKNIDLGLGWQHTGQTEEGLRHRWAGIRGDPRRTALPSDPTLAAPEAPPQAHEQRL